MEVFGQPTPVTPTLPDQKLEDFRLSLITEELKELQEALANKDLVSVADGLGDLLYVVYGTAHAFGIPIDAVFAEIHNSNMSKLAPDGKPMYRESDGKVMKGPNYFRPNLKSVIYTGAEA